MVPGSWFLVPARVRGSDTVCTLDSGCSRDHFIHRLTSSLCVSCVCVCGGQINEVSARGTRGSVFLLTRGDEVKGFELVHVVNTHRQEMTSTVPAGFLLSLLSAIT